MKTSMMTVRLAAWIIMLCTFFLSCDKHNPNIQSSPNNGTGIRANIPNTFRPPDPTCNPVTDVRFYGEYLNNGYTNWMLGWSDGNSTGHTYSVQLFDRRVSTTQFIWWWSMVQERSLALGVLEGKADSTDSPYFIKIQVNCSSNVASAIIVEDVVMK